MLADHDELVDLVVSGSGGLSQLGAFFDRLQQTHDQRMRELGLS
ncbi:hydroxylase for synthesis of 2-methylthio-cis-ribozeatin in tRNA [Mycobacterium tuberculosis]|uniref:Hydroxylase for synthesis of 2-methylthio-cis-ribozeatin in tRNA n=1 Tax=Mycobacterium tuberculosis TaxID=1773 RepID=A0A654U4L6_MYCTX|nr:hydroxylase for synthesis of 2-methylthio-cis-ribozeatin in tRNA [Mycobacterium tuberculosis]CFS50472.1 hydroxylase for synthesis of 2-methylthio-cis-ribozeatin in tRNA [Mycobacterium tuberculosis]CNV64281.1 hydroxylase for synthesis of 2-methylthio-cis-ribozeatin in tRNA [Mycobacterium tuberculosis]COX08746.1 hydroxylase for synthesis of 2-methylthio-cis-ribozeatin in tRNA [Mycobacterium tuberculosis]COX74483.1 hydroxylase for synthesis of 2-methylthio-cis-ribozeatin in tRNA [Mycobacterium 